MKKLHRQRKPVDSAVDTISNYADLVFVSPQDYKRYFKSLADFIYQFHHLYSSRGYTERIKVFDYDGEYISAIDGGKYIVLVDSKKRVLTEKYFKTKYVALDKSKLEEYYKIAREFGKYYRTSAEFKDDDGYIFVWRSTPEDISKWMIDNNVAEFSVKADI